MHITAQVRFDRMIPSHVNSCAIKLYFTFKINVLERMVIFFLLLNIYKNRFLAPLRSAWTQNLVRDHITIVLDIKLGAWFKNYRVTNR